MAISFEYQRDEAAERKRTDTPSPDDPQSSRVGIYRYNLSLENPC